MKRQRVVIGFFLAMLLSALTGSIIQGQVPVPPLEIQSIAAVDAVGGVVPIQGGLTDASGKLLDGSYNIRARIYDASTGGTTLCDDTDAVSVDNGLFKMYLDGSSGCTVSDIDGKQIYLGITVGSDAEMTHRQSI
jgi:hypothetical protein